MIRVGRNLLARRPTYGMQLHLSVDDPTVLLGDVLPPPSRSVTPPDRMEEACVGVEAAGHVHGHHIQLLLIM